MQIGFLSQTRNGRKEARVKREAEWRVAGGRACELQFALQMAAGQAVVLTEEEVQSEQSTWAF